jgi:hypothetical protein
VNTDKSAAGQSHCKPEGAEMRQDGDGLFAARNLDSDVSAEATP